MSVENFVRAMPKVELHVHLEGGINRQTLLVIADQNEIAENLKHFNTWVSLWDKPDYDRLDDLVRVTSQWLRVPEDLTRLTYDLGTNLAKQNVRYAEVTVNPALYADLNLSLDQFFAAINDGRERAERAWGIQIAWILAIPREEPRKADDYSRWATMAAARKNAVVALGLVGREEAQPVGQFERAFHTADKKLLARVIHAGETQGAEGILSALETLLPNRIADGWGAADSPEVIGRLAEAQITLDVSMARALRMKKIAAYADYPLRKLYDDGVPLTIGADMPAFFKTTLTDQYLAVVNECGFGVDELQDLALNAVRASLLPNDDKQALLAEFTETYQRLREEHIAQETT